MKIPLVNLRKKKGRKVGCPLKNDSTLVNLLSRLPTINNDDSYEQWKKEFLERLGYFLIEEGTEKAEEAHHVRLRVKVEKLVRVISKIAHHVNDRSLSPTKITIQARNSLDEAMKSCEDMSTYLKVLSPLNSIEEKIVGFTKYNTASILVETGFNEYERLNMCRDILQVLRENFVNPVAEPKHIIAFDKYEKEMMSFKTVLLDDVGLLPVLKKQRQLKSPIPPKSLMTEIRRGVLREALVSKSPVLANRKSPEADKRKKKTSSESPVRRQPKSKSPKTIPEKSADDAREAKRSQTKSRKKKDAKSPTVERDDEGSESNHSSSRRRKERNRDEGSKANRSSSRRRRTKNSASIEESREEGSSTQKIPQQKKGVPLKKTKKPKSRASLEMHRESSDPSRSDPQFTRQDGTSDSAAGYQKTDTVASLPQAKFSSNRISLSDDEKSMSSVQRKNLSRMKVTTARKAKTQFKSATRDRNKLAAMRGQKTLQKKDFALATQSAMQPESNLTSNRCDSFDLIKQMKPLKEDSDRRLDAPINGKETSKKKRLSKHRNSGENGDYKNIIHGKTNPDLPRFEKSQSKSSSSYTSSLLGGLESPRQSEDEASIGFQPKTPYEKINLFQVKNGRDQQEEIKFGHTSSKSAFTSLANSDVQKNGTPSFYNNFVKPLTTSEHNITGNNQSELEVDKDIFEDPSVCSSKYMSGQSSKDEAYSRLKSDDSILELQQLNRMRNKKEGKSMVQTRRDRNTELLSPTERRIGKHPKTRATKPVTPTERQKATARGAEKINFEKRHSLFDSNKIYSPQKKGFHTAEKEAARMANEVTKLEKALEDNQHPFSYVDEKLGTEEDSGSCWKFKEENEDFILDNHMTKRKQNKGKILSDWPSLDHKVKKGEETSNTAIDDEDDYYREVELKMGNKISTKNGNEEESYREKGGELEIAENIFKFNTDKYDVELKMDHDNSFDKEEEDTAATDVEDTEATDEDVSQALEMVEKMLSVEGSNDQSQEEEIFPSRRFRDSRFHDRETSPFISPKVPSRKHINATSGESMDGMVAFDSGHRKPKSEILRRPTKRVEDSGFFSLQSSDSLSSRYFSKSLQGRELPTSSQQRSSYRTGNSTILQNSRASSLRGEAMREDRMTGLGKSARAYDPTSRLSRWQASQEKKRVI